MSPIPTVLVVCLLVIPAQEANLLPHGSNNGELQLRQIDAGSLLKGLFGPSLSSLGAPTTVPLPPCGTCSLKDIKFDGLVNALRDLGPALQAVTDMLGAAINELLTGLRDLKVAILKCIQSIRDNIENVLDKLSTAVANIITCPSLKDLFKNLKVHLYSILNILANQWYPLISQPDLPTTLTALSQTLIKALPDIVKLLRDILYNLLQVLQILGLCNLIGPLIWKLLDPVPSGTVFSLLKMVLESLSDKSTQELLTTLLGGIPALAGTIPSPLTLNASNLVGNLFNLICNLLKILGLGAILPCDKFGTLPLLGTQPLLG